MLKIKESTKEDLKNIQSLWADPDVMKYAGFPNGLKKTDEEMNNWFKWIDENRPMTNHYSIYEDDVYLGETFYSIDSKHDNTTLDIKLFKIGRGKGVAYKALSFAIIEAFKNGATKAYVDPHKENIKAIALYTKLGFKSKPYPEYIKAYYEGFDFSNNMYMEIDKEGFNI